MASASPPSDKDNSTSNADGEPSSAESSAEADPEDDAGPTSLRTPQIRAAKLSVHKTDEGVVMDVVAGRIRLRLYINGQWPGLVQRISVGEGELPLVPYRMAPLSDKKESAPPPLQALGPSARPEPHR